MKGFNAILCAGILIFSLVIGMTYAINALGTVDDSHNMTDSPYEEQYDSTVQASVVSFSLIQYLPLILAVLAIVAALVMMRRLV